MNERISIGDAIALLNEMVALDKPAIAALVANRVPCNEALADHPSIQVGVQNDGYHVGLLGVINGMFGVNDEGQGAICVEFKDGHLSHFRRTLPAGVVVQQSAK